MRAYLILINNHLRSTSCSTTTPSLSLSTQGFQLSSSRSSIDQFAKYTTPPSPPPTPALPKQLPICQEDQSLQVLISVHPRLPPKKCIAVSQFLSRSCASLWIFVIWRSMMVISQSTQYSMDAEAFYSLFQVPYDYHTNLFTYRYTVTFVTFDIIRKPIILILFDNLTFLSAWPIIMWFQQSRQSEVTRA